MARTNVNLSTMSDALLAKATRDAIAAEAASALHHAHHVGLHIVEWTHREMTARDAGERFGMGEAMTSKRVAIASVDIDVLIAGLDAAGLSHSVPNAYEWVRTFRSGKLTKSGKLPKKQPKPAPAKPKFSASDAAAKLRKQYSKRQIAALIAALAD